MSTKDTYDTELLNKFQIGNQMSTPKEFLSDLRQELIKDNPDYKILFDYIDGKIKEGIEQHISDAGLVSIDQVKEMINSLEIR